MDSFTALPGITREKLGLESRSDLRPTVLGSCVRGSVPQVLSRFSTQLGHASVPFSLDV